MTLSPAQMGNTLKKVIPQYFVLTLYTLTSAFKFFTPFSIHFLLYLLTRRISLVLKGFAILQPFPLILMNLMFDSGVILLGEIKCLSLVGVKGLFSTSFKCINESPIEMLFDFNFLVSGFG